MASCRLPAMLLSLQLASRAHPPRGPLTARRLAPLPRLRPRLGLRRRARPPEALKHQREANQRIEELEEELETALRTMRGLQDQVQTLEADMKQGQRKGKQREVEASNSPMSTYLSSAEEDQPPRKRKKSSAKKKKTKRTGRPDGTIQDAFKALLRSGMGISEDDPWPEYPSVGRDSEEWPRHDPELDPEDQDADAGSEQEAPRGRPLDRLDWVGGAINDKDFKEILARHAKTIADDPDRFDLPDEPHNSDISYVRDACKRTLKHVKRSARLALSGDAAEQAAKQAAKNAKDRRQRIWSARQAARVKAAKTLTSTKASQAFLAPDCVEADESEPDDEAGEEEEEADEEVKKGKVIRLIVPEWWSNELLTFQKKLAKKVPSTSSGYRVRPATKLRKHREPLSAQIPRAAVSAKWAKKHALLVTDLKKNEAPFKPEVGAFVEDENAYGTAIENLLPASDASDEEDVDAEPQAGHAQPQAPA
ncbi:hypothetical protein V8E36_007352 [Tilletia maclaganii]